MNSITVYTTHPCVFCQQAKALLNKRGLQFSEIDLARDEAGRAELARRTGMMTFPQVIIGDHVVGGFTELRAAAASGRLDELLAA